MPAMKPRLEEKEQALRHEMEQFLEVLKVLGPRMIKEPAVWCRVFAKQFGRCC